MFQEDGSGVSVCLERPNELYPEVVVVVGDRLERETGFEPATFSLGS